MPWLPGDMAAPVYDFFTLVLPQTQVLLGEEWMTVHGLLPCATGVHGSMCSVFALAGDGDERLVGHYRLDRQGWLRHPIGKAVT